MQEIKDFEKLLSDQCFGRYLETTDFYCRTLNLYPQLMQRISICETWFNNLRDNCYIINFEE